MSTSRNGVLAGSAALSIATAQADVRRTYAGGFHGQLVSAAVWLSAAATATWGSSGAAIAVLFLGGSLIFPLTWTLIRLSGRPASLPAGHPMKALAMQIAFTVPLGLVVVVAMLPADGERFFPASMVVVGAHYLPFVFLYGMRAFAALSLALVVPGVMFLLWVPVPFAVGGWLTGAVLLVAALLLRAVSRSTGPGGQPHADTLRGWGAIRVASTACAQTNEPRPSCSRG